MKILYIIDEDEDFIRSKEFAEQVQLTGSYVVLLTRDNLKCLPCSLKEIYTIKTEADSVLNRDIKNTRTDLSGRLLLTITKNTPYAYKKEGLAPIYTEPNNIEKILFAYGLQNSNPLASSPTSIFK